MKAARLEADYARLRAQLEALQAAPEKDFAILVACNQGGTAAARACDDAVQALMKERERVGRKP